MKGKPGRVIDDPETRALLLGAAVWRDQLREFVEQEAEWLPPALVGAVAKMHYRTRRRYNREFRERWRLMAKKLQGLADAAREIAEGSLEATQNKKP